MSRSDADALTRWFRTLYRADGAMITVGAGPVARAVALGLSQRPGRAAAALELEIAAGGSDRLEAIQDASVVVLEAARSWNGMLECLARLTTIRPGALFVVREDAVTEWGTVLEDLRVLRPVTRFESTSVGSLAAPLTRTSLERLRAKRAPALASAERLRRSGDHEAAIGQLLAVIRDVRAAADDTGRPLLRALIDAGTELRVMGQSSLAERVLLQAISLASAAGELGAARRVERQLGALGVDFVSVAAARDAGTSSDSRSACVAAEDGSRLPLVVEDLAPNVIASLDEISSQITRAERQCLYKFFATLWSGEGDVIEMGPFLGSSTRAIAMGMRDNPRRSPESRLHSFDRFDFYCVNDEDVARWIAPVFDRGLVDRALLDPFRESSDFEPIFHALHEGQPYEDLLEVRRRTLPSRPEEPLGRARFALPEGVDPRVVFVDGCKNWYALKSFMLELSERVAPGAVFLFQDYSWMDCFFVPVFLDVLADVFELTLWIDNTYVFQLHRDLTRETLERRLPDEPAAFGRERFAEVFERLEEQARERGDARSCVVYPLQHARALCLLGELEAAWRLTEVVRERAAGGPHAHFPDLALDQPFRLPGAPYQTLAEHLQARDKDAPVIALSADPS